MTSERDFCIFTHLFGKIQIATDGNMSIKGDDGYARKTHSTETR